LLNTDEEIDDADKEDPEYIQFDPEAYDSDVGPEVGWALRNFNLERIR
jgi:hypothetical protein